MRRDFQRLCGQVSATFVVLGGVVLAQDEEIIGSDAVWRYWDGQALPEAETARWKQADYDDSGWKLAAGPFGYGNSDGDETPLDFGPDPDEKVMSYYFRHAFTIDDPQAVSALRLSFQVDDGAIMYVNGQEVGRYNMRTDADLVRSTISDNGKFTVRYHHFAARHFVPGRNVLAVHVRQADATSSDLRFRATLSPVGKGEVGAPTLVLPKELSVSENASVVVRRDGWVALGSPASNSGKGSVDIYRREADESWTFFQRLELDDPRRDDGFGSSLAFHEETQSLLVGVSRRQYVIGGKTFEGSVAVFRRDAQERFQFNSFIVPEAHLDNVTRFGVSLAIDGDEMLVGAPGNVGHAVFYRYQQGQWRYQAHIKRDSGVPGFLEGSFGISVALEGDRAAVGDPSEPVGEEFAAGAVYLYERSNGEWRESRRFQPSQVRQGWGLGSRLYMQGNTLVASASGNFFRSPGAGAVFIFQRSLFGWRPGQVLEGDARFPFSFGSRIAFHGNRLVIGETSESGVPGAYGTRRIYFYSRANEEAPWILAEVLVEDFANSSPGNGGVMHLDEEGLLVLDAQFGNHRGQAYPITPSGAPIFRSRPETTASSGTLYRYQLEVTPALEGLVLEAIQLPPWLTLTPQEAGRAVLEGTPGFEDAGLAAVVLRASLNGIAVEQRFQVHVGAELPTPEFSLHPEDVTTLSGRTARFTVELLEEQSVQVVWWHDGEMVEGETGFTLTLKDLVESDAGEYWATVTNAADITVASRRAVLRVVPTDTRTAVLVPDDTPLADALEAAGPGSEIFVRAGVYGGDSLTLERGVTLTSLDGPETTSLNRSAIVLKDGARLEGFSVYSKNALALEPGSSLIGNVFLAVPNLLMVSGDTSMEPSAPTHIARNRFAGNDDTFGAVMLVIKVGRVVVANNLFTHIFNAIYVDDGVRDLRILHNTFAGCHRAVSLETNEGVQIVNNVFSSTEEAIVRRPLSKYANLSSIHQNVFFDVPYPLDGNRSPIEGNLMGDPRFVDPSGGHFALGEGSAATDAGVVVELPVPMDIDILGTPRHLGGAPDAGAYEFDPADPPSEPALRADSAFIRLSSINGQDDWTTVPLEGLGESWAIDSIPEWVEARTSSGSLPALLELRVHKDWSPVESGDTVVLRTGDEIDRFFLKGMSFELFPMSMSFPDPDPEKTRRILATPNWLGYLYADGRIEPARRLRGFQHAELVGDRLYIVETIRQAISIVDTHTLDEIAALPAGLEESAIFPREDGAVFSVTRGSRRIVREGGESEPLDPLGIADDVSGDAFAFSRDGSELLVATRVSTDSRSARFSRFHLDFAGVNGVDVNVSATETGARWNAPIRRSPQGRWYYWGRLLIDADSLEVSVMEEEIVGFGHDDDALVMQTRVLDLATGQVAPLPINAEWACPLGADDLFLRMDRDRTLIFEPAYVVRRTDDADRLSLDSFYRFPDGAMVLTCWTGEEEMILAVERSSDGLRWQELPNTRFRRPALERHQWLLDDFSPGLTRLYRLRHIAE